MPIRDAWPLIVLQALISDTTDWRKAFFTWAAVKPPAAALARRTARIAASAAARLPASQMKEMQKSPLEPGFQLEASIVWTSWRFSRISCQRTELSPLPSTMERRSRTGAAGSVRPGIDQASAARTTSTFSKRCSRRGPSWSGSAGTRTGASRVRRAAPKCRSTA